MNDKTKSKNKSMYSISIELQEGRTAEFNYSDRDMAETHFLQLQAQSIVGSYAIKSLKRNFQRPQ